MMCHECDDTAVARGLCDTCYHRAQRFGTLGDYPTTSWHAPSAELRSDVVALRRLGWTMAEIARYMRWRPGVVRRVCAEEGVGGRRDRWVA